MLCLLAVSQTWVLRVSPRLVTMLFPKQLDLISSSCIILNVKQPLNLISSVENKSVRTHCNLTNHCPPVNTRPPFYPGEFLSLTTSLEDAWVQTAPRNLTIIYCLLQGKRNSSFDTFLILIFGLPLAILVSQRGIKTLLTKFYNLPMQ